MVMYHSLSGNLPFDGMEGLQILGLLVKKFEFNQILADMGATEETQRQFWLINNPLAKRRPDLLRNDTPVALLNLMQKCWVDEPNDRPLFPEIRTVLKNILWDCCHGGNEEVVSNPENEEQQATTTLEDNWKPKGRETETPLSLNETAAENNPSTTSNVSCYFFYFL